MGRRFELCMILAGSEGFWTPIQFCTMYSLLLYYVSLVPVFRSVVTIYTLSSIEQ
jgi:hypothetical protein